MIRVRHSGRLVLALPLVVVGLVGTGVALSRSALVGIQPDGSILIPNGQALTPAGDHIEVSDRPLGMVFSPNGTQLAVVTGSNFGTRWLHIIDPQANTLKQSISIGNSFVGVDFSPAGDRIYVGGGASNDVKFFALGPGGTFAADGRSHRRRGAERARPECERDPAVCGAEHGQPGGGHRHGDARDRRTHSGRHLSVHPVMSRRDKVYVSNWGGRFPGPATSPTDCFRLSWTTDRHPGQRHRLGH